MTTILHQATIALALVALGAIALSPETLADGRRRFSHGGGPRFAAPQPRFAAPHRHFHHAHPRFRAAIVLAAPPIVYRTIPQPVYVPPPVYVERNPYVPPGHAEGYWYWCASAGAYYPYVTDCPEGWQPVVPRPPS